MKKLLLAAGFIGAVLQANAQDCAAVATLNEDFSEFTAGQTATFPQFCWTSITGTNPQTSPMVYPDASSGNKFARFYSLFAPNTAGYLVSPAISSFDGNHTLTFDAASGTASAITVQVGYLTNPTDASTFVEVGDLITLGATAQTGIKRTFPAVTGNAYVAFKFIAPGVHQAGDIDNVVWAETPAPACEAVSTLNEDFSTFAPSTTGAFPQNCWSAVTTATIVYVIPGNDDTKVQFYSGNSANEPGYLVSPEIDSFDGKHTLTFDAASNTAVSLQPGYFTNATDAATFVTVGDAITLTATATTYNVTEFPELTGSAYIAFQFTAPGIHNTATVDNVKWQTTASTGIVNAKAFTLYPNPAKGNVNIVNNANTNGTVNIFSLTGAQVYSAKIGAGEQSLNLSGLQSGMYIVQVQAGNAVTTQKLILE